MHELILDNPTDYSLFKDDVSTESVEDLLSDHDNSDRCTGSMNLAEFGKVSRSSSVRYVEGVGFL